MKFSEEIISVFDYLGEKMGVAIDWTSSSVMPYLQELCGKYINWEIWTSIAWIVIGLLLLITGVISIKFAMKKHKEWKENGCDRYDLSKAVAEVSFIIGIALISIFVIMEGINAFDIIKCLTFPEMKIYEYITSLMSNN